MEEVRDAKARLNEYCQQHNLPPPLYTDQCNIGKQHAPRWSVTVRIGEDGKWPSRTEWPRLADARTDAAGAALAELLAPKIANGEQKKPMSLPGNTVYVYVDVENRAKIAKWLLEREEALPSRWNVTLVASSAFQGLGKLKTPLDVALARSSRLRYVIVTEGGWLSNAADVAIMALVTRQATLTPDGEFIIVTGDHFGAVFCAVVPALLGDKGTFVHIAEQSDLESRMK